MAYTPYGWQDAPDGWKIGDAIPDGYEDSEINATNLEAFGAHILAQASFDLVEDADTGWPTRPAGARSVTWIGWTDPTALMAELDRFIPIPEPS